MTPVIMKVVEVINFTGDQTKIEDVGQLDVFGEAEFRIEGARLCDCYFRIKTESYGLRPHISRNEETNSIIISCENPPKHNNEVMFLITAYRRIVCLQKK